MPPEFAERLRQQVLAEVANTLQTSPYEANVEEAEFTPTAVPTTRPMQPYLRQNSATADTGVQDGWVASLGAWLQERLQVAPSFALAGATFAVLALLVWGGSLIFDRFDFTPDGQFAERREIITSRPMENDSTAQLITPVPSNETGSSAEETVAEPSVENRDAAPTAGPAESAEAPTTGPVLRATPVATTASSGGSGGSDNTSDRESDFEGNSGSNSSGAIPTVDDFDTTTDENVTEEFVVVPTRTVGNSRPTATTTIRRQATSTSASPTAATNGNRQATATAQANSTAYAIVGGPTTTVQATRTKVPVSRSSPSPTPSQTAIPGDGSGSTSILRPTGTATSVLNPTVTRTPTRRPLVNTATAEATSVQEKDNVIQQPTFAAPFTPTPQPTVPPTSTATRQPTPTRFSLPTLRPLPSNTATVTRTPTATNTATATRTPTVTNTATDLPTATSTATNTVVPTAVPPTPTPVPPTPVPPTPTPVPPTPTPTNSAPVVAVLERTIYEDTADSIPLRSAISDPDGDVLTITQVNPAQNGTIRLDANDVVVYNPYQNFVGMDSFTYIVTDGKIATTGVVRITVVPVNDTPVFKTEFTERSAEVGIEFNFLVEAMDDDAGDLLTITLDPLTTPSWLSVQPVENGRVQIRGIPGTENVGDFTIIVSVTDSAGAEAIATFKLVVSAGDAMTDGADINVNAAGVPVDSSSTITDTGETP